MKPTDYDQTCREIAQDIERLGAKIPKLAGFSVATGLWPDCTIRYAYDTRPPPRVAGWRGGFPTTGPEGLSLYLHLWDERLPLSQADTQPVQQDMRIGRRRVTYLITEGDNLPRAAGPISAILQAHGMVEGKPEPITLSHLPRGVEIDEVTLRPAYPDEKSSPPLKTSDLSALMDAAKPLAAADPHIEAWQYETWLEATFTARGRGYRVTLFRGGRGRLDLPDDSFGYFDVAPKVWKKIGGPTER